MHKRIAPLLLALLLVVAGCAGKSIEQQKPEPPQAAGPARVRALVQQSAAMDALIAAFNEQHPGIRVEKVPLDQSSPPAIFNGVKAHLEKGDVDLVEGSVINGLDPWLTQGKFMDLGPYIQKVGFDLKPAGAYLDYLRRNGKLYGLVYWVSPQVLAYNVDLFKAAQVEAPRDGWTWDDFRAAAARLTKEQDGRRIWGFASETPDWLVEMYAQGRRDEASLRGALQFLTTMIFSDKSMAPRSNSEQQTFQKPPFRDGLAAMTLTTLDESIAGDFAWDVLPYPTQPQTKPTVPPGGSSALLLLTDAKQPDAAWEFIRFVAGPTGAELSAKHGRLPVYRTPAVERAWFAQQPAPPPGTALFFADAYTPRALPPLPQPSAAAWPRVAALRATYRATLRQALSGEKPWESALAECVQIQQQIDAEMKQS